MGSSKRSRASDPHDLRAELEGRKREATLQVLFKVARLLDERALARIAEREGAPRLRRSHTSLLPHIDLEGTRVTELADRVGVTKQAVSQLVDELESWGVLARVADPDDARARRVVFTDLGKRGLIEGLSVLEDLEAELASAIGKTPMKDLRRVLLALHDELTR
jgi:DNA-binding MarR family transcriptional regulator